MPISFSDRKIAKDFRFSVIFEFIYISIQSPNFIFLEHIVQV